MLWGFDNVLILKEEGRSEFKKPFGNYTHP